jgi:hypothetical protein
MPAKKLAHSLKKNSSKNRWRIELFVGKTGLAFATFPSGTVITISSTTTTRQFPPSACKL